MAKALGVLVTDYTFEDCKLALAEGQLRLPSNTGLLEFARLVRSLGWPPHSDDRTWTCGEGRQYGLPLRAAPA
ncbi:UNVERIFIED_CONTAM: Lysophosphatidylcholine acyltransferase 1 [Gekko kuhli]